MAYHLLPDEPDYSLDAGSFPSSASLIRVAASEQQAPGALHRCPVCGQPYLPESLPVPPQQIATPSDERLVFVCEQCGTYSVGLLRTRPADADSA